MTSANLFLDALHERRSRYDLEKRSPIPDTRIQQIIREAILHVPSAYNSQSTRIVLLLEEEHDKLWEITKTVLKAIVPDGAYSITEKKLNGFKAAYSTILFFDDRDVVQSMQKKFPNFADKFPSWATESNAMHQYAIWVALQLEGLGCNLQHYNPLINAKVQSTWGLPDSWELKAQMVLGTATASAKTKTFLAVEDRFTTFGAGYEPK